MQKTAKPVSARLTKALRAFAIAGFCATSFSMPAKAAEIVVPTGVVELFTSQGCSSCPPADRVLSELAASSDTLALAWHVDYWDYIGWKDIFASPENTKRQRAYAVSMGETGIYTPQAVINGRKHVVGSRGKDVMQLLASFAGTQNGLSVPIGASVSDGVLKINIAAMPEAAGTTLWMIYYKNGADVKIERGELAGKTLRYSNVVKQVEMIGMVGDKPLQAEFPLQEMAQRGFDSGALVLQKKTSQGTPGPIVGAAIIRDL